MNYGFVIDNRRCIGCHACSTACKSENQVPLGVARTWVKYTEVGQYPDVRRNFQVTRCNHCVNPPCVRICPVTAMYQRADGIVEFDKNVCIGCKACMQACPYDAIHIDPDSGTAAKCHYCAHRVGVGLEPACVVVCPEHAIIAGDMDDPTSEISHVIAKNNVTVRKPEQGTGPKLFYIEGHDMALTPTATVHKPHAFLWAESKGEQGLSRAEYEKDLTTQKRAHSGAAIRTPGTQGHPPAGPIHVGGTVAEHMVQVAYNMHHKIPWHWPVPAYLVTKGIATGLFMVFAVMILFGWHPWDGVAAVSVGLTSLIFALITTVFLVVDLERPERFLRIVFRPQMKSWLARGAFLLIGFSLLVTLWWGLEALSLLGWGDFSLGDGLRRLLLWIGLPLGFGAAVYTAFLFGQAEGRDLWQSPLLPVHIVVQAMMMGAGFMLLLGNLVPFPGGMMEWSRLIFLFGLVLDLSMIMFAEFAMPHPSETAAQASHEITHGKYKNMFWLGAIVVGHVLPILFLLPGVTSLGALAALMAAAGLYCYEHAFVMAPQRIPNS